MNPLLYYPSVTRKVSFMFFTCFLTFLLLFLNAFTCLQKLLKVLEHRINKSTVKLQNLFTPKITSIVLIKGNILWYNCTTIITLIATFIELQSCLVIGSRNLFFKNFHEWSLVSNNFHILHLLFFIRFS